MTNLIKLCFVYMNYVKFAILCTRMSVSGCCNGNPKLFYSHYHTTSTDIDTLYNKVIPYSNIHTAHQQVVLYQFNQVWIIYDLWQRKYTKSWVSNIVRSVYANRVPLIERSLVALIPKTCLHSNSYQIAEFFFRCVEQRDLGPVSRKARNLFGPVKHISGSSVSKNGEVHTPDTSCVREPLFVLRICE